MDFTTFFELKMDNETVADFKVFSWQEALDCYLKALNANGFEIDEKLHRQIVELAKFRRVSL